MDYVQLYDGEDNNRNISNPINGYTNDSDTQKNLFFYSKSDKLTIKFSSCSNNDSLPTGTGFTLYFTAQSKFLFFTIINFFCASRCNFLILAFCDFFSRVRQWALRW